VWCKPVDAGDQGGQSHKPEQMEEELSLLFAELDVLAKILYRNHNQHGRTKLFNYLKRVKKTLAFLSRESVVVVHKSGASVLRLKTTLSSSTDASTRIDCLTEQRRVMVICIDVSRYCIKAVEVLKAEIAHQHFVPLFTTILALASRLLRCLVNITSIVHAQHDALLTQLSNVCLLNPRYLVLVQNAISEVKLCATDQSLLSVLLNEEVVAVGVVKQQNEIETKTVVTTIDRDDEGEEVGASATQQLASTSSKKKKRKRRREEGNGDEIDNIFSSRRN